MTTLFESKAERTVKELLLAIKRRANEERKAEAEKRLDYYHDNQLPYLMELLDSQFSDPSAMQLQPSFTNIVRRIIDDISLIYKREPLRRVEGRPEDVERYREMMAAVPLDIIMATVNRYTNLCKTVLLKVGWREGALALDILTPNIVDVVQNPEDPTRADAIIYSQALTDTLGEAAGGRGSELIYTYWSESEHFSFDAAGRLHPREDNPEGVNPYGALPFVVVRDRYPVDKFFIEGGDDLINAQDSINVKLTELNYLIKMQSFSQPVLLGWDGESQIAVDPSRPIKIQMGGEGPADFRFVTPEPKITELFQVIQELVIQVAGNYRIAPSNFALQGSVQSGFALKLENFKLLEARENDLKLYRTYEQELFGVMRRVWNTHRPLRRMSEGARLTVDFGEVTFPQEPEEMLRADEKLLSLGLTSRAHLLMKYNRDIKTLEEAEAVLSRYREINERTAPQEDTP